MEAVVIKRSILVKADQERVWRTITTPEQIAKWFEPMNFARLAVGEPITFGWGEKGEIALVEPIERFGYRWQLADPDPNMTLVVFSLETIPEGTLITVTEDGFEALPEEIRQKHFTQNNQGWDEVIAQLGRYIETGSKN